MASHIDPPTVPTGSICHGGQPYFDGIESISASGVPFAERCNRRPPVRLICDGYSSRPSLAFAGAWLTSPWMNALRPYSKEESRSTNEATKLRVSGPCS